MESALVSILIEAIEKVAVETGSKLFVIFESPTGGYRFGGDREMMESFQNGLLVPKASGQTTENQEESYKISTEVENSLTSIGLDNFENAGNVYKLSRDVDDHDNAMVHKINFSDHDNFSEKAECVIFNHQEYTDVKPALFSDCDEGDQNAAQIHKLNDKVNRKKISSEDPTWNIGGPGFHSTHTTSGMKKCGLCPPEIAKTYKYKGYLCHRLTKHDRKHLCTECNRTFQSPGRLRKHKLYCQRFLHKTAKAELSKKANGKANATKIFSDSPSKTQDDTWNPLHLTDTISGMKKCGLCPPDIIKTYKYKGYLCHRITKHDRKHVCNECNRSFPCPARLKKHRLDCPRFYQT